MNQRNNITDDKKKKMIWICQTVNIEIQIISKNFTKNFKKKALPYFHTNVCSLTKNVDDFNMVLSELNVSFDILAITESWVKKNSLSPINLQLRHYSI